jgi:hypothetical protein
MPTQLDFRPGVGRVDEANSKVEMENGKRNAVEKILQIGRPLNLIRGCNSKQPPPTPSITYPNPKPLDLQSGRSNKWLAGTLTGYRTRK